MCELYLLIITKAFELGLG